MSYSSKSTEVDTVSKNVADMFTDVELQNGKSKRENDGTPYEDALRLTGYGRFHHWLLVVSGFGIMGEMLEKMLAGYLISSAQCDFNMTDQDKGLLGAITYIGSFCSTHIWGVIADTRGRKKVIQLTLICDAIVTLLSSLSPTFWSLVLFRFINGFFLSAPISLVYAYVGEFNTPQRRNQNLIWISLFASVPSIILPVLAWAILPQQWNLTWMGGPYRTWRLLAISTAIPGLMSGLCLFTLPESPKFLLSVGKRDEALGILRRMYACNTGNSGDCYSVKLLQDEPLAYSVGKKRTLSHILKILWNQTAPLFKPPFLLMTVLVCFIQYGNIAGSSGLSIWLPELFNMQAKYSEAHPGEGATFCYAAQNLNGTSSAMTRAIVDEEPACVTEIKEQVFINTLIMGAVSTLVPLPGGLIVNLFGKKKLLIMCMVLTGSSAVALNYSSSYVISLILVCIVTSFSGMCISIVAGIIVEIFPTNLRGMALSLSLACGRIGSMTGNLIFGFFIRTHCEVAFYFFGTLLLLNAVAGSLLPNRGRFSS